MRPRAPQRRFFPLLLALGACVLPINLAGDRDAARSSRPSRPLRIDIQIEEMKDGELWRIRYRFSRPLAGIVFPRDLEPPRTGRWMILPPEGARRRTPPPRWGRHGESEAILLDGPAADPGEISLEIRSDYEERPADYLFNVAFSEGSRLLYTGHLAVRPLVCADLGDCSPEKARMSGGEVEARWEFRTSPDRGIRVLDRSARGRLAWTPPRSMLPEDGTYAYFGDLEPVRTERMSALVDPGLPPWMVDEARASIPRNFDYFAERLGIELDFHPLVLFSYTPSEGSGLTFKGGTLDGLIQVAAIGTDWRKEEAHSRLMFLKHLAHESFHLWNGQMFRRPLGDSENWLTEGSADYFAYLCLRDLGSMDKAEFSRAIAHAANRCLVELDGEPLVLARERGRSQSFYSCGSVVQFLVDRAVGRASSGARGIGDLFGRMFRKALKNDRNFSTFDFLETYQSMVEDPIAAGPIVRLLHLGVPAGADEFLRQQLSAAGMPVKLVPIPEALRDHPGISVPESHPSCSRLLGLDASLSAASP
ncbi:MAG: hypothetical protein HY510_00750 [Acidobacteria bacterium]|nr:hypothetical protein [Acidobacteriota bacterium]